MYSFIDFIAKTLLYSVSLSLLSASIKPAVIAVTVQMIPIGAEISEKIGFAIIIDTRAVP